MAKEDEVEQELDVTRGIGGMEERTRIYLEGADSENLPLVDKTEYTDIGLGGMEESVDIRLRRAGGCFHVIHAGSEIGATCAGCGGVMCLKCSAREGNLCAECKRPVCGSCQRRIWFRSDDSILCPACAHRWWLKELLLAGAAAVLVLLFFVMLFRF